MRAGYLGNYQKWNSYAESWGFELRDREHLVASPSGFQGPENQGPSGRGSGFGQIWGPQSPIFLYPFYPFPFGFPYKYSRLYGQRRAYLPSCDPPCWLFFSFPRQVLLLPSSCLLFFIIFQQVRFSSGSDRGRRIDPAGTQQRRTTPIQSYSSNTAAPLPRTTAEQLLTSSPTFLASDPYVRAANGHPERQNGPRSPPFGA